MGGLGIPGGSNFRLDGAQFRKVPRRDRHDAAHNDDKGKGQHGINKVTHVPY